MSQTLAEEQRKTKPRLEDVIASHLGGDVRQSADAFLAYCEEKKITYPWHSTYCWNLTAKGKVVGSVYIGGVRTADISKDRNAWYVQVDLREFIQYEDYIEKENLLNTILENVTCCIACPAACKTKRTVIILGKEFRNACGDGKGIRIKNPSATEINSIKKIIDFRLMIPHGTASHPIYDPATEGLDRIDNRLRVSGVAGLSGMSNKNLSNLFDGKYKSYYYVGPYGPFKTSENSHDVVFALDAPIKLKAYGLVSALRLDIPSGWVLYGGDSANGPWLRLDRHDEFPKPVMLYSEKAFMIHEPVAYQYYRIIFEGRNFVVSQMHLYK